MKNGRTFSTRGLVIALCITLVTCALPLRAMAGPPPNNKAQITLTIGQPSIWSLAQAHYLLAKMRDADKDLAPTTTLSLNPNDTNGFRFDVLRQVFGGEGGFNGVAGAQNQAEMDRFQQDVARRQTARTRLDEALDQRQIVFTQLARVSRKLAAAQVEEDDLNAIPEKDRPDDFKTQLQNVQKKIKDLKAAQAELQTQKEDIDGRISAFENDAKNSISSPTLKGVFGDSLPTGPAGLTSGTALPSDIGNVIDKILANPPNARLNASTMLDNHIQLQYEIIAKQLTLLRDEIGPDQRLVFMELPLSLYTVPGKSDDYLVQIDWKVKSYYGLDPNLSPADKKQLQAQQAAGEKSTMPLTLELIDHLEKKGIKQRFLNFATGKTDAEIEALWQVRQAQLEEDKKELDSAIQDYQHLQTNLTGRAAPNPEAVKTLAQTLADEYEPFVRNPALAKMQWRNVDDEENNFRTLDIIPRQSALNVNAANASSTGFNLAAAFQWLTGIGARVSYQRQREVYEQFVNQEIFASGSGKGVNQFSWTFGPLPGTNRIAPGVKTTYAVLIVPKDALILTLHAQGISYKKKQSPDNNPIPLGDGKDFRIVVPDEQTEGFWLNAINYTPVVQGERVTAVLTGQYFSPQISVLVNGTPLTRVVSIGASSAGNSGTGVQGVFEYLSSNEIVASFSMGSTYTGTPIITLITPEKTGPINYFKDLRINFRSSPQSLNEASRREPMFLHHLEVSDVQVKPPDGDGGLTIHLIGDGFRNHGEVAINGIDVQEGNGTKLQMLSTGAYEIKLNKKAINEIAEASGDPAHTRRDNIQWQIRYRQHTRQGYEYAPVFNFSRVIVSDYDIVDFAPNATTGVARLVLKIYVPGQKQPPQASVDGSVGRVVSVTGDAPGYYRVTIDVNKDQDSFPLTVTREDGSQRTFDEIGLPEVPTITSVFKMGTTKAEGPSDTEHEVQIMGSHLKRVVQVMFNITPGQIIQGDNDNVLIVKTPKLDGPTRVLLRTDVKLKGRPVTNIADLGTPEKATYTFKKADDKDKTTNNEQTSQSGGKKKESKKTTRKKTATAAGK
ncbi:MAG TPA: hypothetical protein VKA60_09540 [Blastocatellia bacterium]|nr:hypothetical protein [Blastocatellia bacterium]